MSLHDLHEPPLDLVGIELRVELVQDVDDGLNVDGVRNVIRRGVKTCSVLKFFAAHRDLPTKSELVLWSIAFLSVAFHTIKHLSVAISRGDSLT